MFWAIAITLASVVGGTLLALMPHGRDSWMGPVRTFALMAALSVVVLHLLPEALSSVGAGAILVFILGLLAPEALGKIGVLLWRAGHDEGEGTRRDLALEASYAGLLLHRVGDGLGLGAFTAELSTSSGSGGVVTALAAHAVPVVAIVVLTFDSVRGRGSALKRAAGLAVASMVGVLLAHSVAGELLAAASAWVAAFVGGMLIHVVTHDLSSQLPKTPSARVGDIVAAALGVYVSFLGRGAHRQHHGHGDHGHEPMEHFQIALTEFSVETGPLLVLGLGVGALLATLGSKIPPSFFRSRGAVLDAARGTVIGAPLPLCSCSVLPISAALKGRGAAPALVVAFLLATPELGVETFALSVRFLGWELAWTRLAGALLVAFFAAMVVSVAVKQRPSSDESVGAISAGLEEDGPWLRRAVQAFDELFHHVGAWMILGVVAAALLEVGLPASAFVGIEGILQQFAVISLVAVPSYVCAPSATPLAAVLLAKGLSPGAVIVGLLLGPATNVATLVFLRRWFGSRAAILGVLAVVALSWGFGMMTNFLWGAEVAVVESGHEHDHSTVWRWLAGVSGLLLLRAIFKSGVRGFLSTLQGEHGHSHGGGEQGHSHGGDDHAQGHGH